MDHLCIYTADNQQGGSALICDLGLSKLGRMLHRFRHHVHKGPVISLCHRMIS